MSKYTTHKLKIGKSEQLEFLSSQSGELYTRALVSFWRVVRKKGIWLKPSSMMRWHNSKSLHAHSADAVVQSLYTALKSWRQLRKKDPRSKPPKLKKKFYKVAWKDSSFRVKSGYLVLSNGKGNEPLRVAWRWDNPKLVEVGWDGEQYELRAIYFANVAEKVESGETAGVDLGEIHIATVHTGKDCFILNGRELRSKRRYQNKLKAQLSSLIDKKKRGSRRWKRSIQSRRKQLRKVRNQINDILHKQTTKLISVLKARGTQRVVIGNVRGIRRNIDKGKIINQKLHQWLFCMTRHMLEYKAERVGMETCIQDESYSSQDCLMCGERNRPKGRTYKCRRCGFKCHRDFLGSANIRKKYLGEIQVVGAMASPIGLRYTPHGLCSSGDIK